jgi:hypothetical protein
MSVSLDTSFLNDVGAKPFFPPPSPLQSNGANLEYFIIYISCKLLALFGAGIAYQVFAFEGSLS